MISYNPITYPGGLEKVVRKIVEYNGVCKTKYKIILIHSSAHLNSSENNITNKINKENIIVKSGNITKINRLTFIKQIIFSIKVLVILRKDKSNNIIHIHGSEYAIGLLIFKNFIKNSKIILTAHGSLYQERYALLMSTWRDYKKTFQTVMIIFFLPISLLVDILARYKADYLTCVSINLRDYFYKINKKQNMSVIHNGFDFVSKSVKYKKTHKNHINAIIVGSKAKGKGLDIALQSIKTFNETNQYENKSILLYVIGFKDYYTDILNADNYDFVKYIGVIKQSEVFKYYYDSDFLIFPTRYEGFPLTVIESLYSGLPIITTKASKISEIKGYQNATIIVNDYKIDNWVKSLKYMITYLEEYKLQVSKLDLSPFAWQKIIKDYYNIYEKID